MKKNWIRFGLLIVLTAVFLYFFLKSVDWKEAFGYLSTVNLPLLILTLLIFPVCYLTRALRWKYLLRDEKPDVSLYNRFAAYVIGFTVVFIFPARLGELVRPLYLAQKENMRKGFVLGTAVVERIFDIFTMCFLLGLFLLIRPLYSSFIGSESEVYSNLYIWGIVGCAVASAVLVVTLLLYFFKEKTLSVILFFLKPLPKKITEKIIGIFEEFVEGLKFFRSLKNFLIFILMSFVVWLSIIFFFWIFFFVFRIKLPYFVLFPYVFMIMVGAAIPTPGMVGGYHWLSKLGLTSLYGIDANLAVSMTVVMHASQLVLTCLIGYVILWREGISLLQIKKMGEGKEK
jgi:uncharacterized protein (TIRG00374 family)